MVGGRRLHKFHGIVVISKRFPCEPYCVQYRSKVFPVKQVAHWGYGVQYRSKVFPVKQVAHWGYGVQYRSKVFPVKQVAHWGYGGSTGQRFSL